MKSTIIESAANDNINWHAPQLLIANKADAIVLISGSYGDGKFSATVVGGGDYKLGHHSNNWFMPRFRKLTDTEINDRGLRALVPPPKESEIDWSKPQLVKAKGSELVVLVSIDAYKNDGMFSGTVIIANSVHSIGRVADNWACATFEKFLSEVTIKFEND